MDKEKMIYWLAGLLILVIGFVGDSLYVSTSTNAVNIAQLQGHQSQYVTKEQLNGRLDRIDDKIEKLSENFRAYLAGQLRKAHQGAE